MKFVFLFRAVENEVKRSQKDRKLKNKIKTHTKRQPKKSRFKLDLVIFFLLFGIKFKFFYSN